MTKLDKGLHLIVFLFFLVGLVFSTVRIVDSFKFLKSKKTSEASIFLKSRNVDNGNKNTVGIYFWDENIKANRKVKLIIDPLKYKELASLEQVSISYGKNSNDVYLIDYNEPNKGRMAVSLIGWLVAFCLVFIYVKKISRVLGESFK